MEAAVAALHQQLKDAGIPHAFGGAFALRYYGAPRPTNDIDVNVFVPTDQWPDVRNTLIPLGIEVEVDEDKLRREGQIRLHWNPHPLHLFFSCDPLHDEMERGAREIFLDEGAIPIVSPEHLVIRKTLLGRSKDQRDIEAILAATPVDQVEVEKWVRRLTGASFA